MVADDIKLLEDIRKELVKIDGVFFIENVCSHQISGSRANVTDLIQRIDDALGRTCDD